MRIVHRVLCEGYNSAKLGSSRTLVIRESSYRTYALLVESGRRKRLALLSDSCETKIAPAYEISPAYETKSAIKHTWVPRVADSILLRCRRGRPFPGRRVSTHRHTCLRKASSPSTLYPSESLSASWLVALRLSHLSNAFLRVPPSMHIPRHGLNLPKRRDRKGVRARWERDLNGYAGYMSQELGFLCFLFVYSVFFSFLTC